MVLNVLKRDSIKHVFKKRKRERCVIFQRKRNNSFERKLGLPDRLLRKSSKFRRQRLLDGLKKKHSFRSVFRPSKYDSAKEAVHMEDNRSSCVTTKLALCYMWSEKRVSGEKITNALLHWMSFSSFTPLWIDSVWSANEDWNIISLKI